MACKGILVARTLAGELACILALELRASLGPRACIITRCLAGTTVVNLVLFC